MNDDTERKVRDEAEVLDRLRTLGWWLEAQSEEETQFDPRPPTEVERWQRIAVRLALILARALTTDADEFLDLAEAIRFDDEEMCEGDFRFFMGSTRMRVLVPSELYAIETLLKSVRHA